MLRSFRTAALPNPCLLRALSPTSLGVISLNQ
jgi:hypothetical protein